VTKFLQYVISGLSTGSIYALVALGLALIYRSTRILNFAHGDITTAGTFFAFMLLGFHFSFGLAFALAILFGAALAMAFLLLHPSARPTPRGDPAWTNHPHPGSGPDRPGPRRAFRRNRHSVFPLPLSDTKIYRFAGVVISQLSLGTLLVGLLASLLFYLVVQKTKLGLAMRATSENLPAAQTMASPPAKSWP